MLLLKKLFHANKSKPFLPQTRLRLKVSNILKKQGCLGCWGWVSCWNQSKFLQPTTIPGQKWVRITPAEKELPNRIWLGFFPTSNTVSNSCFRPASWSKKPRTESGNQERFWKYMTNPAFFAQKWRHGCTKSQEMSWKKNHILPVIVVSRFGKQLGTQSLRPARTHRSSKVRWNPVKPDARSGHWKNDRLQIFFKTFEHAVLFCAKNWCTNNIQT